MDQQRAKEIAASSVMANVTFDGQQIYIEKVDEQNGTATIYPLAQPEQKQNVLVDYLVEY